MSFTVTKNFVIKNAAVQSRPSASLIVSSGLVLNLDAGNATSYPGSGSNWYSLTGSVTASITSATYRANSGSFFCNGASSNFITVPNVNGVTNFSGSNKYTVQAWVKISSNQTYAGLGTDNSVMEKWSGGAGEGYPYMMRLDRSNTTISTGIYDGTNSGGTSMADTYNTWIMLTGTYDLVSNTCIFYKNVSVSSSFSPTSVNKSNIGTTSPLYLWKRGGVNPQYGTGEISKLMIYNRILSVAEINQNFNAIRTRFGV